MNSQQTYSIKQVAEKLGVNPRTILREVERGRLQAQRVGRKYIVAKEALQAYLKAESFSLDKEIHKFCQNKKQEMITLLQKLVSIPSDYKRPDNEEKIARFIKDKLENFGIRNTIHGEGEAVTVRGSFGYADQGILLNSPLDTLPTGDLNKWSYPPFEGIITNRRMFGRGTADCKAGIVAMIYAVLALQKVVDEDKVRVELVFDGGEQNGNYFGMQTALQKGLPVQAGVIGYAGPEDAVGIGCRGYHRYTFETKGHARHTGAQWNVGVNAISKMAHFIVEMERLKLPRGKMKYFKAGPRLTFSMINGGKEINIVPDECLARVDIRTLPGQTKKTLEKIFNRLIKTIKHQDKDFKIDYYYNVGHDAYVVDEQNLIIKALQEGVAQVLHKQPKLITHGPSHIGTLLHEHKIPVVVWGPDGGNVHSYDEYVKIDSIPQAAEVYARMVLEYFGVSKG